MNTPIATAAIRYSGLRFSAVVYREDKTGVHSCELLADLDDHSYEYISYELIERVCRDELDDYQESVSFIDYDSEGYDYDVLVPYQVFNIVNVEPSLV